MMARVIDGGDHSETFGVTNGTKQGCVLAPVLFGIIFAAMLLVAFSDFDRGITIEHRTDGDFFNIRRLQAKTKVSVMLLRDFLFADDCALAAHSLDHIQVITNRFAAACHRFGLTISLKKTEVLFQPRPGGPHIPPVVTIDGSELKAVNTFCYLGSTLSENAMIDDEITSRIGKASAAFGKLQRRLWNSHAIKLSTKIAVYRAVVITTLLYGCETWTVYRRHIKRLAKFHLRCLRKITNTKWQDQVPNTEVLEKCHITGIEAFVIAAQLRWSGHVARMDNTRIPKAIFYGQLRDGARSRGGQRKRFKDVLKANLKVCNIETLGWDVAAAHRSLWRSACKTGVATFEEGRLQAARDKRHQRKHGIVPPDSTFICPTCGRACASRIGLFSHQKSHRRSVAI
jgi:hypothetical protein